MEDKHKNIIIPESGQTRRIILNRPDKRNSLDDVMIKELTDAINGFSEDKETRSIVITGAGGNFCSGLYLDYLHKISEFDVLQNKKDSQNYSSVTRKLKSVSFLQL